MKLMKRLYPCLLGLIAAVAFYHVVAFAETAIPTVTATPTPTPTGLLGWLAANANFTAPTWVTKISAFIVTEAFVRFLPTKSPTSLFYLVGQICTYVGQMSHSVGAFADSLNLQNSVSKTPPPAPTTAPASTIG